MNEIDIFSKAVEFKTPDERRRFLDEVCQGNARLRERLEALLTSADEDSSFMESFPASLLATLDQPSAIEEPGTMVGPYKLREQIGEGGFGVVYVAEQEKPVRRRVALKIIKPGMDSQQVIARFEAERQALAMMDHPNIARVFDAGTTENGRPYFVMELVRGIPITEYCDKAKLDARERLKLMIPVCQAVQHAHQKGIIHRDLKPSNVLVTLHDGVAVPKVIDFGVAKAISQKLTEQTVYTRFAEMIGTPLYMSPEQAELSGLDVDTRSDVYSLGVLLYELLTGTTPFDKETLKQAGLDELRRIIREEEPLRPSMRISTIAQDALTTITSSRNIDSRRLRQTLRGDLDWIVMKALEKDRGRRYESASALAADLQHYLDDEPVTACPPSLRYRLGKFVRRNKGGVFIAGLSLVFLISLSGFIGWTVRTEAARVQAVQQQVSGILKESDQSMEQEKWPEALSAVRRADEVLAGVSGQAELKRRVDQTRRDVEMVLSLEEIMYDLTSLKTSPNFDFKVTDVKYAEAFRNYGIDVDGMDAERAAELIRASRVHLQLALALDAWAEARWHTFNRATAWKKIFALASMVDPDPWRCAVRKALGSRDPVELVRVAERIPVADAPPVTLGLLGRALTGRGAAKQGEALMRRAQRRNPTSFWLNYDLADACLRQTPPRMDEAVRFLSAAIVLRPKNLAARWRLGDTLRRQGKYDEALAEFSQVIEMNPKNAAAWLQRGRAYAESHQYDKAIADYSRTIELDPDSASGWAHRGNAHYDSQQYQKALADHTQAIKLEPQNAWPFHCRAFAHVARHEYDKAIADYSKAIELSPSDLQIRLNLGSLYQRLGEFEKAIAEYRRVMELDPDSVGAHIKVGLLQARQGKRAQAIAAYRKAITLKPTHARPYNSLAWLLATFPDPAIRDPQQAVAMAEKAVELAPTNGNYWNTLGVAHYRAGHWKAAIAALHKSMKLRNGGTSEDWFFLAMAHWQRDDHNEARRWFDQAAAWMDTNKPDDEELKRFRDEAETLIASDRKSNAKKRQTNNRRSRMPVTAAKPSRDN